MPTNHLAGSTSPYLQQHADNPVAWYPWGETALERAREADSPILLSIGYAACHWCHVMAHESFEDAAVAERMNRWFVNIKVDREERPDLDRIYQFAFMALNGRGGGWPLTVFLDPHDLQAFFAGTYFPPAPVHGMPAFPDVLERLAEVWRDQRDSIREQNRRLAELCRRMEGDLRPAELSPEPVAAARRAVAEAFDRDHGGLGGAPKFPQPGVLGLCLYDTADTTSGPAPGRIAQETLAAMAAGGIHDQIGGGFARYSVDAGWQIPHFEKMLYDNALLLGLYADAAVRFGRDDFARVARGIADWAEREMRAPGGGYCASLDADSDGEEGRFYVWQPAEVAALLSADEYSLVARHLGFDREANFDGRWHPVVAVAAEELAAESARPVTEVEDLLAAARAKLYAARAGRVWPARDDKVLTAWNAMLVEGLATAGRCLGDAGLVDRAADTLDFLHATCWRAGRLYAVHRDGTTHQPAFLEDHAALLAAIVALLQARWRSGDAALARAVADALLAHFEDTDKGGFFQTADDHEALPWRPRPLADDALPSANGVAALALARLGHLLGEARFLRAAERTVALAMPMLHQQTLGHATLVRALAEQLEPPEIVRIHGPPAATADLASVAAARFDPGRLVFAVPPEAAEPLPPAEAGGEQAVGLVCRGRSCEAPLHGPDAIAARLGVA